MHTGTMWALVKDKPEQGLTMKRVEIPAVGDNDVMIEIHKTAICGTDVHIWDWNPWAQETIRLGTTAGHEYVGHIVEMGKTSRATMWASWSPGRGTLSAACAATAAPAGATCVRAPRGWG